MDIHADTNKVLMKELLMVHQQVLVIIEMGDILKIDDPIFQRDHYGIVTDLQKVGVAVVIADCVGDTLPIECAETNTKLAEFLIANLKRQEGPIVALISKDPFESKLLYGTHFAIQVTGTPYEEAQGYFETYEDLFDFLEEFQTRIELKY